jgi:hypothetical protein
MTEGKREKRRKAMSVESYALTSSIIFFLVAVLHSLRLVWQWPVMIDGWHVPMWVSVVGLLMAGFLSFVGFRVFQLAGGWFSLFR